MEMNVGYLLTKAVSDYPDKVALAFEGKELTYRELNSRVNSLANGLLAEGIKKGDKVAILLRNSNELIESFFATVKIRGVVVPINYRLTPKEVAYIVDNADASTLIYGEEFREGIESIRSELEKVKRYVFIGDDPPAGTIWFSNLIGEYPDTEPDLEVSENDECELMYTSGTTGRPKGTILTHRNVVWGAVNMMIARGDKPEDRALVVNPLYHIAGLNSHLLPRLGMGAMVVLKRSFNAEEVMETIHRERITAIGGVPTMYSFILQLPDLRRYDIRSVSVVTSGGAHLTDKTKQGLLELFPNAKGVFDIYGCTEVTSAVTILRAQDSLRKPRSVGKPPAFNEVKVINSEGEDVAVGEVGEVICRGPTVMKGYYKNPQATEEAIRDGWFYTGDLAQVDEEGYIYLMDREKDMIISGGENIYSKEVEDVLHDHPSIEEAAVIGVPDEQWGESVKAVVVLKPGEKLTEEEIINFCKERLASYKKPKSVEFVDSLPKSPFGKVLKRELRERYGKSRP